VKEGRPPADPVRAIAALDEPTRRRLYAYVAGRPEPVGRDEAADALGIGRPLVAFHLERLLRAGLLTAEYRRLRGRSGPGAGRPAKLYSRAEVPVELSLPARRYAQAADLFAAALEMTDPTAVLAGARARGEALGASARRELDGVAGPAGQPVDPLLSTLRGAGYEPREDGSLVVLRNCPFDALVADHRGLTCAMNLALLEGIRSGVGETDRWPRPVTIPGACCVAFGPPVEADL
jgi:predicted ArsR family transcriptional regulator